MHLVEMELEQVGVDREVVPAVGEVVGLVVEIELEELAQVHHELDKGEFAQLELVESH